MKCRHCNSQLEQVFIDLAYSPVSNAMLTKENLNEPEPYYPLKTFTCQNCWLVQVDEIEKAERIFNGEYTYFSSFSTSWLAHAKAYVDMMMKRFNYTNESLVVEIASNDGYLLQYFKEYHVPVLGVDPTANTAKEAKKKGISTIVDFFSTRLATTQFAEKGRKADLIIGNNVLAHVPNINDFVKGMKIALKKEGVITMEFPHLVSLVEERQFDTIYHEHFSYLSFYTVKQIFESQGLEMFDVQEIPTHGGSLRIFAKHPEDSSKAIEPAVNELVEKELKLGINTPEYYASFQEDVKNIKYNTLQFLLENVKAGKKIIGYGAAAKGNTFLNYMGIKGTDIINFVADASPHKQNKYMPGSHIPVLDKQAIAEYKPDYVIIFPWNLKKEISQQLDYIRAWGGKFVIFIPEVKTF